MAWFMHMTSPPDCSKRPVAAREFAKSRATASRQWYIPPEPPNQWIHHIPPLFIGRRDWYKEITAGKLIKSSTLSCLFMFIICFLPTAFRRSFKSQGLQACLKPLRGGWLRLRGIRQLVVPSWHGLFALVFGDRMKSSGGKALCTYLYIYICVCVRVYVYACVVIEYLPKIKYIIYVCVYVQIHL